MEPSFDNRFRIVQAMARLMVEKTLKDIRTTEICKEAEISRQTFYRCFEDKYAAAIWFMEEMVKSTVRRTGIDISWEEGFRLLIEATARNQRFIRQIFDMSSLSPVGSFYVQDRLESNCNRHFAQQYAKCSGKEPSGRVIFQIKAFTKTLFGLINEWIKTEIPTPDEALLRDMASIVPRELYQGLSVCSQAEDSALRFFF